VKSAKRWTESRRCADVNAAAIQAAMEKAGRELRAPVPCALPALCGARG